MKMEGIKTEQLTVGYDNIPLITDICLQVRRGEILTLVGKNGAGKSTILKSIAGALSPLKGTVLLNGVELKAMKRQQIAQGISAMLTERFSPEYMTCREVVSGGRYPYTGLLGVLGEHDKKVIETALQQTGVEALADRPFSLLSDGQKQRVLLARALCQEPEVLILDEPTSYLDIRYKLELLELLQTLAREKGIAIILSLHELDLIQKISDTVVCVNGDRIESIGPPERIFSDDHIDTIFELEKGRFQSAFGSVELKGNQGEPKQFVIGGGGAGIPIYRYLQRKALPFAAGILMENDVETPVARALASKLIIEQAFEPIKKETFELACTWMKRCDTVILASPLKGSWNDANCRLAEMAGSRLIRAEKWRENHGF